MSGTRPGDDVLQNGLEDVARVFFSFPEVTDPDRHRDYNAWHQYDHLPQNRALRAVRHGERWVVAPRCRAAASAGGGDLAEDLAAAHYVAMYWFADPVETSVREWLRLGSLTDELGRRPELGWTRRRYTGFARPVGAALGEGVLVTVGAVPHLPHAGVVVEVVDLTGPGPVEDPAVRLAQLVATPGVLGAFAFDGVDRSEGVRIHVAWCSADPVAVSTALAPPGAPLVLRTAALGVTPGSWDWFDPSGATEPPAAQ